MSEQNVMAKTACQALDEKKGEDIKIIEISQISIMADYFIIANEHLFDICAKMW